VFEGVLGQPLASSNLAPSAALTCTDKCGSNECSIEVSPQRAALPTRTARGDVTAIPSTGHQPRSQQTRRDQLPGSGSALLPAPEGDRVGRRSRSWSCPYRGLGHGHGPAGGVARVLLPLPEGEVDQPRTGRQPLEELCRAT